ncbi:hypothetical protein H312_00554 [Anncaliia algerae PRA339]|uniref:Uncharacterized protein n=1 Tax=Anncaliia algerae PRA339 TaxID=1288291 RepID=A0A059F564_9MICR|nr:hypothetical protein H312_00554 [Anncaliia algerae PRA339]
MVFIYMQAFMIFHLITLILALRNDKNKKLHIPTIQQFDIVVDNTNEANPSYTVYSYSNEPPLHTYNTDDSTYIDSLDDETILKNIVDNYNYTNCEKNKEYEEKIIDSNINSFSHPKIIKKDTDKHNIPYGEIVYSVCENPLDIMYEDFILDSVECSKEEYINVDYKLPYGKIIYMADQETTDLVSQVYTEDNKTEGNEKLDQNMNPLINNPNDGIHKEKVKDKDLNKYDTKNNSGNEEVQSLEDIDNGVLSFSIVGFVVLVVLNI